MCLSLFVGLGGTPPDLVHQVTEILSD